MFSGEYSCSLELSVSSASLLLLTEARKGNKIGKLNHYTKLQVKNTQGYFTVLFLKLINIAFLIKWLPIKYD